MTEYPSCDEGSIAHVSLLNLVARLDACELSKQTVHHVCIILRTIGFDIGGKSKLHKFRVSDVAEFCYKCTDVYDPNGEGGIPYNDPTVNVQWPDCGCPHLTSEKDQKHTPFAEQKFEYFEKW